MPTLFVDNLTTIDFSYLHRERGLVGETWIVDVELDGDLDEQGMVFDFGHVKPLIKGIIDRTVDHSLVVPTEGSSWNSADNCALIFTLADGSTITHRSPEQALCRLPAGTVEPESVASWLEQLIIEQLPENVMAIRLALQPEQITGAFYHYSHGLRAHDGNCQRIAHGHRSRIEIHADGVRRQDWEADWAERWRDIYIASEADLKECREQQGVEYSRFAYQSPQGEFEITLPTARCEVIDTDSTVELIAAYIHQTLNTQHPGHNIQVRAFEGVGKGALAG